LEVRKIASNPPLPSDIRRRIARDFGPADASALLAEFDRQRTADPDVFSDRIIRCIVYVANGELNTAQRAVSLALTDWRDLIVWAEYDNNFDTPLRDLGVPFAND